MRAIRDSDITLFSRYECKYLIDPILAPEVRAFLRPFVTSDRYASRSPDGRYPICSLYLDSDELTLYQQTVCGERDRFKLRARTYSDDPGAPVFLEVKNKLNNIVRKRRARVDRSRAIALMKQGISAYSENVKIDNDRRDAEYFASHQGLIEARPVMKIKYLREAYESNAHDPVRITLDTDLEHAVSFEHDLLHDRGNWIRTPMSGTILEIKYTNHFPTWVRDLVQIFGLRQQAVPKYILSMDRTLNGERGSALSIAGFTLPPLMRA